MPLDPLFSDFEVVAAGLSDLGFSDLSDVLELEELAPVLDDFSASMPFLRASDG